MLVFRKNDTAGFSRLFAATACLLATVSPLSAQDTDVGDLEMVTEVKSEVQRENLVTNSPFRLVRTRGPRSASTQPLEIRGFVGKGDSLEISLTNPATRECHWIKVGDRNAKWFVESADPIARTAVVNLDGIAITIEMVKASETPMSIAAPLAPRAPTPPVTPPANTTQGAASPQSQQGQSQNRGGGRLQQQQQSQQQQQQQQSQPQRSGNGSSQSSQRRSR